MIRPLAEQREDEAPCSCGAEPSFAERSRRLCAYLHVLGFAHFLDLVFRDLMPESYLGLHAWAAERMVAGPWPSGAQAALSSVAGMGTAVRLVDILSRLRRE